MPRYLAVTVLTLFVLAAPAQAATILLDFDLGLQDLDAIPQTYGDAANVDATYSVRMGFGNSPFSVESAYYWSTGYSGTTDVSWTGFDTVWELYLEPTAGNQITLNSFSLHSWEEGFYTTGWQIWNGDFSLLLASSLYASNSFMSYSPAVTSTNGIRLQYGPDPANVGIDNISFDVSEIPPPPPPPPAPVPEPSTLLLLGGGLLAGARRGWRARRRQKSEVRSQK